MKYIVIGLGNYGYVLAEELAAVGHEVIGVDINTQRVDSLKEKLAAAFVMDATDEQALAALPLRNVDAVIVAIGENFGASVRVTALLKQMKVEHIFARANDGVHRSILQAFEIEKVLSPEADAAHNLVEIMDFGYDIETFRVDKDYVVVKFNVPEKIVGYSVPQLHLADDFGLKLMATIRGKVEKNALGINYTERNVLQEVPEDFALHANDQLVIFGKYADFRRFWRAI
ncbi:MAG: TrkA family potassium uptake protein [Bacteroidaceae bacterium]|nr:TrkA family potassium uptake protein [Bacteroidaceae bacterium]